MNRPIAAFRFPRAVLAAVAALALMAPHAATFACRGEECCAPGSMQHAEATSQHMPHHGVSGHVQPQHGSSVTDQAPTPRCPTMTACGTVIVALVLDMHEAAPVVPTSQRLSVQNADAYRGRILTPLTPPPRV